MAIIRDRYLNRLIARKHDGFVKIITGLRRCGKSYLLFNLFREHLEAEGVDERHIIGVDLDDKENVPLRDPNRLFDYIVERLPKDGKWTYVFIDEIQMCRKVLVEGVRLKDVRKEDLADAYVTFYDILNSLRKKKNVDVYVTGSNSKLLSKDVATNFRDRGEEIKLYPLSFSEYFAASGLQDKSEALQRYLTWGGMPRAIQMNDDRSRADYLKRLFIEVYLKDIKERNRLKNLEISERILDALSSAVGSLTNPHKLVKTLESVAGLKTSERTLSKQLSYFEDAFLFSKANRYDVRGKKYLEYPSKYYVADLGLRNARLNFRETEVAHLMENVIYNELLSRGYNVDVGVVSVMRRDKDGKQKLHHYEIDFIVNFGLRKLYIQSAYEMPTKEKVEQEKTSLTLTNDFFGKIIIENGYRQPMQDEDGIWRMGIIPFLLSENLLEEIGGSLSEENF